MDKKRGCLWAVGAAVVVFILLGVGATLVDDGEVEQVEAPVSVEVDVQAVLDALEAARDSGVDDDAPDLAQAAVDAAVAVYEGLPGDVRGSDEWTRAVFGVTLTRRAQEAGAEAYVDRGVAHYEFLASKGGNSREACTSAETAAATEAKAGILYDVALAVWRGERAEASEHTIGTLFTASNPNRQDCAELEPLTFDASGSTLEPDLSFDDAESAAGYFLGTCSRRISQVTPVVEQRQCFDFGAAAFDFFRSWIEEADVTWIMADPELRGRMERTAEDLEGRLERTLDTLGWLGAAGEPRFEEKVLGR